MKWVVLDGAHEAQNLDLFIERMATAPDGYKPSEQIYVEAVHAAPKSDVQQASPHIALDCLTCGCGCSLLDNVLARVPSACTRLQMCSTQPKL